VPRSFRLWGKKRGDRQTGSRFLGGVGEALIFSAMFLFASVSAIGLTTLQVMRSTPQDLYISGWGLWLRVLIIVIFLLVGGIGLVYTVLQVSSSQERRSARSSKVNKSTSGSKHSRAAAELPAVPSDVNITNSPGTQLAYRLPITRSPAWRFLLILFICLVSSSASSVLLMLAWGSFVDGSIDWLALAFLVPAVAVSITFAVRFVRDLTIYLTVGPTSIEISDHPLRPGNCYQVFLGQAGQMFVSRLRLNLVCDEEATYRQGTDVRTESTRVYEQSVLKVGNIQVRPGAPLEKIGQLPIPEAVMHSFQSESNSVRWKLLVTLKPRRWPVLERSFSVVIVPQDGKPE
jgi:hypothetical protein